MELQALKEEFQFYNIFRRRKIFRGFYNPKELQVFIVASKTNYNQMILDYLLHHSYGPGYLKSQSQK